LFLKFEQTLNNKCVSLGQNSREYKDAVHLGFAMRPFGKIRASGEPTT